MPDEYVRSALPRYGRVPRGLLRDPALPDRAVRLYGLLDDYAGADGQAFPRRSVIAESMGCSTDSVDRAMKVLVSTGWVVCEQRFREDGGQSSNLYVLTAGPAAAEPRGGRTGAAPPAAPVRPQEGTPVEGNPPNPPEGGEVDSPLFPVEPVTDPCHTGNMSMTTATRSSRRPEVDDNDPHWSAFWAAYPRKLSKGAARKAWVRAIAKVSEPAVLVRAAERFAGRGVELRYTPYPATWLNQERWLDDEKQETQRGRGMPKKGSADECPDHPGEWADNCRPHAADRLAKE